MHLPDEILDQICYDTHFDTLINFRLVSKQFASVAAQDLFYEVHVIYFDFESVAKLEAISNHKTLRHHVRSLNFQGDWLTAGDKSHHAGCDSPIHRALLDGRQLDVLRTKGILLAALNRLPSLQRFTLALAMPAREIDIPVQSIQRTFCEKLRKIVHKRVPAQFNLFMPHLQATSTSYKRLCLGTLEFMNIETLTGFQHLHQLDLALSSYESLGNYGVLTTILSSVPELRVLSLSFGSDCTYGCLGNSVDEFSMPKLTEVRFKHIHIPDRKLLNFFSRHAKSLKVVRLVSVYVIVKGTPTDIFESMQRILRLDRAYITGEFTSHSGKSMILGTNSEKGQSTQRFVQAYLIKEEPCSFEMAGFEFGVAGMAIYL